LVDSVEVIKGSMIAKNVFIPHRWFPNNIIFNGEAFEEVRGRLTMSMKILDLRSLLRNLIASFITRDLEARMYSLMGVDLY
jgi:hypothetical protein